MEGLATKPDKVVSNDSSLDIIKDVKNSDKGQHPVNRVADIWTTTSKEFAEFKKCPYLKIEIFYS
jgi:hypothetical protein